ncbi:MAG: relaxase/mobilization nuclease domain-containing protein [Oscillospiraceae bacterium]|nr:relaxase/mobilization nuclease domain-containing protein [Oscillospiraceae bacterium]
MENPKKTREDTTDSNMQALLDVIGYTTRADKTAQKAYVEGINCLPETAIQEMILTKRQFFKEDGRLAYHGYLSFKPGEVTAQECQEIGVALAREMWGDRFQVVVTTHLDKNHIHAHFALNSVSFVDGKKYDRTKAEYARMRSIADMLCRERGLQVIENPPKTKTPRTIYEAEKNGEMTRYNILRQAIDRAVAGSRVKDQLHIVLKMQGFEVQKRGRYWAINIIGDEQYTFLYHLGQQYSMDAITKRVYEGGWQRRVVPYEQPKRSVTVMCLRGNLNTASKLTGFRALYVHYLYLLGKIPKGKRRPPRHPLFWDELRKFNQLCEEMKLLNRNKIDTTEQLVAFKDSTKEQIDGLIGQRTKIQNKLRRVQEPEVIANLKQQKTALTAQIAPLRKNLQRVESIEERTRKMRERIVAYQRITAQELEQTQQISKKRGYVR